MTQFAYESAQALFDQLHKPAPVSARQAAIRQVLEKAAAGEHRDRVADALYRQAESPDEIQAILRVRQELDDTEKNRAETQLREQVAASLRQAEPEPRGPYLDDAGQLRSPDGRVVDLTDPDGTWREESWAGEAQRLLEAAEG